MSEDAAVSRKERKAQRDATRHKGSKKRKRGQDSAQDEEQQDFIPLTSDAATEDAIEAELRAGSAAEAVPRNHTKERKSTKARGRDATETADDGDQPPKSKKRRVVKTAQVQEEQKDGEDTTAATSTKNRFILFIGNLPYSTTDTSLQNYFKSIAPFTLRHRTDPKSKKSKGFAFLEFENYDRMQTCIKLYHHSMFNPEQHSGSSVSNGAEAEHKKGKDRGARRINVELTAGGGGNKEGRMEKIKAKNVKLDEQRKRRAEAERKEKEKEKLKEEKEGKAKDGGGTKKKESSAGKRVDAQLREQHTGKSEDASQIHPSRLARVMG